MFLLARCWEGRKMDYKKEIIEMIEKMSNLTFLKMAYGFVRRLYKEEKEQGS